MRAVVFAIFSTVGPTISKAEPISIDQLKGMVISAVVVEQRTILHTGQNLGQNVKGQSTITIGHDLLIRGVDRNTVAIEGKDTRVDTYSIGATPLGKPFKYRDGMMVFTFENSQLSILRTLADGGRLKTLTLDKKADGSISCTMKAGMAKENGVGGIQIHSSPNSKTTSTSVVSASCSVRKSN